MSPGVAAHPYRYFSASSQRTPTRALDGSAPIAASFVPANGTGAGAGPAGDLSRDGRERQSAAAASGAVAGAALSPGTEAASAGRGTLHANLQTCSSTDISASDGVLHVLAFVGNADDHLDVIDGEDGDVRGGRGGDGSGSGVGGVAGAGVLVPDVLELTYAFGFRRTYEAIIDAAAATDAATPPGVAAGGDTADSPLANTVGGEAADVAAAVVATVGKGGKAARSWAPRGENSTVADALQGSAGHTLLVVRDSRVSRASLPATPWSLSDKNDLSEDTMRWVKAPRREARAKGGRVCRMYAFSLFVFTVHSEIFHRAC